MENAVDALKMAFGVLVFVVALSVSIISFGQARETAQYIIEMEDRESDSYSNQYYYVSQGKTKRIVGSETIIPTLYRAYHEQYIVQFDWGRNSNTYIWQLWNESIGKYSNSNTIDLSRLTVGGEARAIELVSDLLSGGNLSKLDESNNNLTLYYGGGFRNIGSQKLFDLIDGKKFEETQGLYYDEDTWGATEENGWQATGTDTPEINKNRKRIITYTLQN